MTARDELERRLNDAGLGQTVEHIAQLSRSCYRVERNLVLEEQIPIGASKFGGSPDVPAHFVWPQGPNIKNPEAMEFVGQIRLADLPNPVPEPAPHDGLLSFFMRWSEGRVFYFAEGTALQRTEGPVARVRAAPAGFWQNLGASFGRKPDPRHTYRACSLKFEPKLSPPDGNSSLVQQLNLTAADLESYMNLCEAWWSSRSAAESLRHQMFGYASPVQNEMELECHFLRIGEKPRWDLPREHFVSAARDWVLLLQVDSDDGKVGPGWMWGDLGMVYFWIHRDDLTAHAFDRAIAIEQCH